MEKRGQTPADALDPTVCKQAENSFSCHQHKEKHILTLVGGDERQLAVSRFLSEAGYNVRAMGLGHGESVAVSDSDMPRGIRLYHRITGALDGCDSVVLPYPASRDGMTVPCPMEEGMTVSWDSIMSALRGRKEVTVFGGRIPTAWVESLKKEGIRAVDYEDSEAFLQKNAYLTAEGAVMTAMGLTDRAILHSKVAVIGFGRIGRELCKLLGLWGADVTVVARRIESRREAEAQGFAALDISEKMRLSAGYDVIFNTVPAKVLDRETLTAMPCGTLLIELASAPGGLDPEGAKEAALRCGLQIIRAPGLPGRYAPRDAGRAVAECILENLHASVTASEGGEVTV